jgi:hypothetical protein
VLTADLAVAPDDVIGLIGVNCAEIDAPADSRRRGGTEAGIAGSRSPDYTGGELLVKLQTTIPGAPLENLDTFNQECSARQCADACRRARAGVPIVDSDST